MAPLTTRGLPGPASPFPEPALRCVRATLSSSPGQPPNLIPKPFVIEENLLISNYGSGYGVDNDDGSACVMLGEVAATSRLPSPPQSPHFAQNHGVSRQQCLRRLGVAVAVVIGRSGCGTALHSSPLNVARS